MPPSKDKLTESVPSKAEKDKIGSGGKDGVFSLALGGRDGVYVGYVIVEDGKSHNVTLSVTDEKGGEIFSQSQSYAASAKFAIEVAKKTRGRVSINLTSGTSAARIGASL